MKSDNCYIDIKVVRQIDNYLCRFTHKIDGIFEKGVEKRREGLYNINRNRAIRIYRFNI